MLAATANLTDALKARISMDPVLALAASVQLLTEPSSVLGALANLCLLGLVGCPARNGAVEGSTFAEMRGRVGMGN